MARLPDIIPLPDRRAAAYLWGVLQPSPATVWSALEALPLGWFTALYEGRRYGVTRSVHARGRSMKLFAEELGGPDRISLNIFSPPSGEPALKPCEMPLDKVTAFVLGATVEPVSHVTP